MKNTKSKLVAASFGAALTSLYAAPELSAQVDVNDDVIDLQFSNRSSGGAATSPFNGVIPFNMTNPGTLTDPTELVMGPAAAFPSGGASLDIDFFNNSFYGFGADIQSLSLIFVLEPCSLFDGVPVSPNGDPNLASEDPRLLSFTPGFGFSGIFGTGVHTFGFVAGGDIGYFRVDLGTVTGMPFPGLGMGTPSSMPLDDAMLLDGAVPGPDDMGMNDGVIKTPGGKGDVNGSGAVDFGDVAPLLNVILGISPQVPAADVNCDGNVDFGDVSALLELILGVGTTTDSNGETVDLLAAGNEDLARRVKENLTEIVKTELAARANGSSVQSDHASVGLAALAMGAVGLRRRRKAAKAA